VNHSFFIRLNQSLLEDIFRNSVANHWLRKESEKITYYHKEFKVCLILCLKELHDIIEEFQKTPTSLRNSMKALRMLKKHPENPREHKRISKNPKRIAVYQVTSARSKKKERCWIRWPPKGRVPPPLAGFTAAVTSQDR